MRQMRQHFRPEFLNLVDDIVLFKSFIQKEIIRIVKLMDEDLKCRLSGRRIRLEITKPAYEFVAREGFDPIYGARPLRRFLQRELATRIGRALIWGEILDGAWITVVHDEDELIVKHENPPIETVEGAPEFVYN